MKSTKLIIALFIALTVVLVGCNTKKEAGNNADAAIADGAASMQQILTNMQKQIDDNKAADVKQSAEKLEEAWSKFEESVKEKSPDLYEKVEGPLGIIEAGAKSDPLDIEILTQSIKDLSTQLTEVAKLK